MFKKYTVVLLGFLLAILGYALLPQTMHPTFRVMLISIPVVIMFRIFYMKNKTILEDERYLLITQRTQSLTFNISFSLLWMIFFILFSYSHYNPEVTIAVLGNGILIKSLAEIVTLTIATTFFIYLITRSIIQKTLS